jgi:hypothetical protein
VLDLTPLAHRSYLAEVERSARQRPPRRAGAWSDLARRAVAAAGRLVAALGAREARGA